MHNINYMMAKAIQKDHLRNARQNRLARLIEAQLKKKPTSAYRKESKADGR